jgi:hypothetical protein
LRYSLTSAVSIHWRCSRVRRVWVRMFFSRLNNAFSASSVLAIACAEGSPVGGGQTRRTALIHANHHANHHAHHHANHHHRGKQSRSIAMHQVAAYQSPKCHVHAMVGTKSFGAMTARSNRETHTAHHADRWQIRSAFRPPRQTATWSIAPSPPSSRTHAASARTSWFRPKPT